MTQDTQGADMALLEQIRQIVADELEMSPEAVAETGSFVDEYDADSLSLIQVFARLERELKVQIPKEEMPNMVNLQATSEIVSSYVRGEIADA